MIYEPSIIYRKCKCCRTYQNWILASPSSLWRQTCWGIHSFWLRWFGFLCHESELETNVTTYSSFCDCQHYRRLNPSRHFRYLWPDKAKDWIDRVLFLGEL